MNRVIEQLAMTLVFLFSTGPLAPEYVPPEPLNAELLPSSCLVPDLISKLPPIAEVSIAETSHIRRINVSKAPIDTLMPANLLKNVTVSDPALISEANMEATEHSRGGFAAEVASKPAWQFHSNSWTTDVFGAAAFGDQKGELYTAHVSFETPIWRQLNLAVQPFGGVAEGEDATTSVFGLDAVLKHPIYSAQALTANFEMGGGLQQAGPESWPRTGNRGGPAPDLWRTLSSCLQRRHQQPKPRC